ncbi:hypothetical protein PMAYCL1PPCAC_22568, partial [Pristionchus mayeri]
LGIGKTCYTANTTSTRFDVMGRSTVETRRGCEVLCDALSKCVGFSFKDAGFSSSCVLLSSAGENEDCNPQSAIFLKKTAGCVDRTNLTAEFGIDPCVSEIVPSAARGLNLYPFCDRNK